MEGTAPGTAGPLGRSGRDRLGEGIFGLGERPCQKGGEKVGKNPTDRGKQGSKRHLDSNRKGVPLVVALTAANVHDSKVFEELVDGIEPIKRPGCGRPRKRPEKLHADKGYDFPRCRRALRERSIKARIARRGKDTSERLVRHRWVVEDAGVAEPLPEAHGALREASGPPRSVPPSRLFPNLPQLPVVRGLERIPKH